MDQSRSRSPPASAWRAAGKRIAAAIAWLAAARGGGVRGDLDLQRELYALGGTFIIAGGEVSYLTTAARADAEKIRAAVKS
jgi:hypothetical protein